MKNTLGRDILHNNAAHAYIFDGPQGSGKLTAAYIAASALLCTNRSDETKPVPCGVCMPCRKTKSGVQPDILYISRNDKASIGVDQIRKLKSELSYAPNENDKKIYIIDDAHLMTAQAQNALLLSLEEPPPSVTFFLLTEDSSLILDTIKSRAPVIRMELFSKDFVLDWLKKSCQGSIRKLELAASLSGGSLGRAKALLEAGDENKKIIEMRKKAEEYTVLLCTGTAGEILENIKGLSFSRDDALTFLDLTLTAIRDIALVKKGAQDLCFWNKYEDAKNISDRISMKQLIKLYDNLIAAKSNTGRNCLVGTVLTTLSLQGKL